MTPLKAKARSLSKISVEEFGSLLVGRRIFKVDVYFARVQLEY